MIRVMLVDDHPVVRAGLRAILDSFNDVTVAAQADNGAEALARATDPDAEPIDVVVMDVQMPKMGGIEATKRIKEAGGPPVLVLTTYDAEADIVEALAAGAPGYLLKDAPEEELHEAVRAVARGERPMSSRVAGCSPSGSPAPRRRSPPGRSRSSAPSSRVRTTGSSPSSCSSRRQR